MPAERRKRERKQAADPESQQKRKPAKRETGKAEPARSEPAKSKSTKTESAKPKATPKAETGQEAERVAQRKPAPRGRRRPEPEQQRPIVRARAKYVRSSARKARLVIEHLRGKSIEEARAVLRHTPRGVARDLEKLLESAVANAENNHDLVGDDLLVKEAYADEGPTIRRFRPRALGRATRIRKRTSHLTLTLTPKE
jgi:ribosomal protein L22